MPEKKVAVIDGNSLMHRAFHAVPLTMNAPDGTPTNAVFGFIAMLLKFSGGVLGYEGKLNANENLEQLFMDVVKSNHREG